MNTVHSFAHRGKKNDFSLTSKLGQRTPGTRPQNFLWKWSGIKMVWWGDYFNNNHKAQVIKFSQCPILPPIGCSCKELQNFWKYPWNTKKTKKLQPRSSSSVSVSFLSSFQGFVPVWAFRFPPKPSKIHCLIILSWKCLAQPIPDPLTKGN